MEGNEAEDAGGALYAEDSQLTFTGSSLHVSSNKASGLGAHSSGGAFYTSRTDLSIQASASFLDNSAVAFGGALYAVAGNVNIWQASFEGNSADKGKVAALQHVVKHTPQTNVV